MGGGEELTELARELGQLMGADARQVERAATAAEATPTSDPGEAPLAEASASEPPET